MRWQLRGLARSILYHNTLEFAAPRSYSVLYSQNNHDRANNQMTHSSMSGSIADLSVRLHWLIYVYGLAQVFNSSVQATGLLRLSQIFIIAERKRCVSGHGLVQQRCHGRHQGISGTQERAWHQEQMLHMVRPIKGQQLCISAWIF